MPLPSGVDRYSRGQGSASTAKGGAIMARRFFPRLPTFNLMCNIWHNPKNPRTTAPDLTLMCNLQFGAKIAFNSGWQQNPAATPTEYETYAFMMWLLVPQLSDIRPGWLTDPTFVHPDRVEVPAGSGRFYTVFAVDDVSKGFPTEYRVAGMVPFGPWPTPIP
jgi:hypothetical protein